MLRSITQNDAARIVEIYAPYVQGTAISFETEVPTIEEMKNRITEITEKFPWLVFESEGVVVGYAYASAHRSRCAYAWSVEVSVYLDTNFHRQGIGRKLYEKLFQLLKEQGAVNAFAGIALPNEGSVKLHESMGFKKIGQFEDIGYKHEKWWDVGWWQMKLQQPDRPTALKKPYLGFSAPG